MSSAPLVPRSSMAVLSELEQRERTAAPEAHHTGIDTRDREPELGDGVVHLTVEGEPRIRLHELEVDRPIERGCVGAGIV